MTLKGMKQADWSDDVSQIQNAAGNPLFKSVELKWSKPTLWTKDMRIPEFDSNQPCLYALIRNHGNSKTKDHIAYIGLTRSPKARFANHPTARAIVERNGKVGFSYAEINFITGKNRIDRIARAMEEIEHLLIWSCGDELENERKMFTLPGMGAKGGNAWHIKNTGFRFSGRMPKEIIYPWMLVKQGRNSTGK